jgi:2-iminobutanoate/2-iminopropanoate deaminase
MPDKEIIGGRVTWGDMVVPLSWAVRAGDTIYVSGMVAMKDNQPCFDGDIAVQTRLAMTFMRGILEEAECTFQDIVKVSVFLKNRSDFAGFNSTYAEYFPDEPPARFTICTGFMHEDCLIEFDATAYSPRTSVKT